MSSLTPCQRLAQELLVCIQFNPPEGFDRLPADVQPLVVAAALSSCGVKCSVQRAHYSYKDKAGASYISDHQVLCVEGKLMSPKGRMGWREVVEEKCLRHDPDRTFHWDLSNLQKSFTPGRKASQSAMRQAYTGQEVIVRQCIDELTALVREWLVLDATPVAPAQRRSMRI